MDKMQQTISWWKFNMFDRSANLISLFASSSTLICCALPAVFIVIGAGATFASIISIFPFLVVISKYKVSITLVSLLILVFAGYINYRTYYLPCPADPELGRICLQTRKRSRSIYYFSVILFTFATIFTYLIPNII